MMQGFATPFMSDGVTPPMASDGSNLLPMGYMAGQQMQYMPQNQFLTPAQYGAYRTVPIATSNASAQSYQNSGWFSSWLAYNRGAPLPFMAPYTINTYNPVADQQAYFSMATRLMHDHGLAGEATLGDFSLRTALGMFGGPYGMAAGLLLPDMTKPFTERIRDMRGIQNLTMSRITGGAEVDAGMGMGFNSRAARNIDSFVRQESAGDALFSEGDYRKLLELGVQNGLFDYANNAQQYKDTLKKLKGTLTTMMEVIGSSDFKDLVGEFKRLQTMGARADQFSEIARKENLYSRMTGLSHRDMVNTYGQQGALIYTQAGLAGYQGSLGAMANAAMVTYAQRTGLITPEALSRNGGISGYTQKLTAQDASGMKTMQDFLVPYFANGDFTDIELGDGRLEKLLQSKNPLTLAASAASRIKDVSSMMDYDATSKSLMSRLHDELGPDMMQLLSASMVGRSANLTGVDAVRYGLQMGWGMDAKSAQLRAKYFFSDDFRDQQQREIAKVRQKREEERAVENSPFRKFMLDINKGWTRFTEGTFGRIIDAYGRWSEQKEAHAAGMTVGGRGILFPHEEADAHRYTGQGDTGGGRYSYGLGNDRYDMGPTIQAESSGELDRSNFTVRKDGTVVPGMNDPGGASFGALQFNADTIGEFILSSDVQSRFGKRLQEMGIDGQVMKKIQQTKGENWKGGVGLSADLSEAVGKFDKSFKELMKDDEFRNQYFSFANNRYYEGTRSALKRLAQDTSKGEKLNKGAAAALELFRDPRTRSMVFDFAINQGANGASKRLADWAWRKFGGRAEAVRVAVEMNPANVLADMASDQHLTLADREQNQKGKDGLTPRERRHRKVESAINKNHSSSSEATLRPRFEWMQQMFSKHSTAQSGILSMIKDDNATGTLAGKSLESLRELFPDVFGSSIDSAQLETGLSNSLKYEFQGLDENGQALVPNEYSPVTTVKRWKELLDNAGSSDKKDVEKLVDAFLSAFRGARIDKTQLVSALEKDPVLRRRILALAASSSEGKNYLEEKVADADRVRKFERDKKYKSEEGKTSEWLEDFLPESDKAQRSDVLSVMKNSGSTSKVANLIMMQRILKVKNDNANIQVTQEMEKRFSELAMGMGLSADESRELFYNKRRLDTKTLFQKSPFKTLSGETKKQVTDILEQLYKTEEKFDAKKLKETTESYDKYKKDMLPSFVEQYGWELATKADVLGVQFKDILAVSQGEKPSQILKEAMERDADFKKIVEKVIKDRNIVVPGLPFASLNPTATGTTPLDRPTLFNQAVEALLHEQAAAGSSATGGLSNKTVMELTATLKELNETSKSLKEVLKGENRPKTK